MRYKIYELISKNKLERDGYDTKTVTTYKLREIDDEPFAGFASTDDAIEYIKSNGDMLKYNELTILPIIKINYDGEIVNPQ